MNPKIDRRGFLKLAATCSMFLVPAARAAVAPSEKGAQQKRNIVDVHHHILPAAYTSALARIGVTGSGGAPFPLWTAQQSLDNMDRNGIATAITSISSPGVYFGDRKFAADLARRCNDFSAELVSGNSARFGGFAVLPLPDVDAAARELEYALDVLKLDGVALLSNVGGHYLGSEEFDDLYSELNRRRAVVYVHPTVPADGKFPTIAGMRPSLIEFVFDTTRAIANIAMNNITERFPDIRFIVAHAGGTAPYIALRISLLDYVDFEIDTMRSLRSLYYDTALSASPFALGSLQKLVDPSRILFGSDYPFAPAMLTSSSIYGLGAFDGFNKVQLQAVYRENALDLFPRLHRSRSG